MGLIAAGGVTPTPLTWAKGGKLLEFTDFSCRIKIPPLGDWWLRWECGAWHACLGEGAGPELVTGFGGWITGSLPWTSMSLAELSITSPNSQVVL